MLTITIEGNEFYNSETEEFFDLEDATFELEHSLVSVSKWESKYKVPFLSGKQKTDAEILYYIECMIVAGDAGAKALERLSTANYEAIQNYIESSESATTFAELPDRSSPGEVITSELIYYWMVAFTIPFECQSWHLNRLFSLIRICNVKQNGKQKKMSKRELSERNRSLNAARRKQLGTSG